MRPYGHAERKSDPSEFEATKKKYLFPKLKALKNSSIDIVLKLMTINKLSQLELMVGLKNFFFSI